LLPAPADRWSVARKLVSDSGRFSGALSGAPRRTCSLPRARSDVSADRSSWVQPVQPSPSSKARRERPAHSQRPRPDPADQRQSKPACALRRWRGSRPVHPCRNHAAFTSSRAPQGTRRSARPSRGPATRCSPAPKRSTRHRLGHRTILGSHHQQARGAWPGGSACGCACSRPGREATCSRREHHRRAPRVPDGRSARCWIRGLALLRGVYLPAAGSVG
jgi:hypothetical protein